MNIFSVKKRQNVHLVKLHTNGLNNGVIVSICGADLQMPHH